MTKPIPRVSEGLRNLNALDELRDHIDVELCYHALLHGFWGQIAAYRKSIAFYAADSDDNNMNNITGGSHRLWLRSQHQGLQDDLNALSISIHTPDVRLHHRSHLALVLELFLMTLHANPEEIQDFAGKSGEDAARRAVASLGATWAGTPGARRAAWHAGQVLLHARDLPPAGLRGFAAVVVYLAGLTLWVYGLLHRDASAPGGGSGGGGEGHRGETARVGPSAPSVEPVAGSNQQQTNVRVVALDGEETGEARAFLRLGRGAPALTTSGGVVESLANPDVVLLIARDIFRGNFPVRSEPLPPLVESLGNLLRDLGRGTLL